MLAFLWQESPELLPVWLAQVAPGLGRPSDWVVETQVVLPSMRRPDIRLRIPGEAVVLIESKLDAEASRNQLRDYAAYLLHEPEPTRALIFLTRKPSLDELPVVEGVPVYHVRWQMMRDTLEASANRLAHDFRVMLTKEGLVMPSRITLADWEAWAHSFEITDRILEVMNEAQPHLIKLEPGYARTGPTTTNATNLLRIHTFERTQFALMFSPGRYHGYEGHIGLIALNSTLEDPNVRRQLAEAAVEKLGSRAWVHYGDWVGIYAPVQTILGDCPDFESQVEAAIAFADHSLNQLRTVEYLAPTRS